MGSNVVANNQYSTIFNIGCQDMTSIYCYYDTQYAPFVETNQPGLMTNYTRFGMDEVAYLDLPV